jgi:hypothetical protein
MNPRGLWEAKHSWPTVAVQTTLNEHTIGALEEGEHQLAHWNVEMVAERWMTDTRLMPGDFAVLAIPPSLAAPVGEPVPRIAVQVTSVSVNFTNDGDFNVKLVAVERDRALPGEEEP